MENRRLRATILNLQDRLTHEDRQRLHFYLKNDVPRTIADNLTLNGTLKLIDELFDRDKINEKNLNFLIDAFTQIRCLDAATSLKSYQQRNSSKGINESTVSLASIMPPTSTSKIPSMLTRLFIDNNEDDKGPSSSLITNEIIRKSNNNNHNIIDSNNINTNTVNINSYDGKDLSPRISKNSLYKTSSSTTKSKLLILILFGISCVLATVLVFLVIKISKTNPDESYLGTKLKHLEKEYEKKTEGSHKYIKALEDALIEAKKENLTHLIKHGDTFGLKSGEHLNMNTIHYFDDSKDMSLTLSHYLSGIKMSGDHDFDFSCQFIYTSVIDHQNITTSVIPKFKSVSTWNEEFHLNPDERINQIGIQMRNPILDIEDGTKQRMPVISNLKFETTQGRSFLYKERSSSLKYESFPGYTLGYVTGRYGNYIHQLQFYWYRTRESPVFI